MPSIATSIAGFVTFMATVPTIAASYTPKTFYAAAASASPVTTPCAITGLKLEEDGDFMTMAFRGGSRLDFDLYVWLLYQPVMNNADFIEQEPGMITLLDNLFVALKNDPMMMTANSGTPTTHYPFEHVKRSFSKQTWGTSEYHAIRLAFSVGLNL